MANLINGIRQRQTVKKESGYNYDDLISGVMFTILIGIVWFGICLLAV